jgi:iduronate 2-sulfatase
VEFVDLYPTLADLCGLPVMKVLEGRSLKPLLYDPKQPWEHPSFTVIAKSNSPRTLAVITERFRLIQNL